MVPALLKQTSRLTRGIETIEKMMIEILEQDFD